MEWWALRMTSVLIYSENKELSLALASKATDIGCTQVDALAFTQEAAEALKGRVDTIYLSLGKSMESANLLLQNIVKEIKPDIILLGARKAEKVIATLLAASLDVGLVNDCTDIKLREKGVEVIKLVNGGGVIARMLVNTKPAIATINARTSTTEFKPRNTVTMNVETPPSLSKVRVIETKKRNIKDTGLDKAKGIVSAGRGFKKKEDLALLNDLAACIHATVGCTRPISADLEWMDQWVGISGKKIAPNLYIACGISGTIQHVAGINDSKIIVGINNDETANIHAVSDYSIVGDLYEVLPLLVAELKKRGK